MGFAHPSATGLSRLKTPDGALILLPYPVVTVDMGQH
jgi:hypothetical protein